MTGPKMRTGCGAEPVPLGARSHIVRAVGAGGTDWPQLLARLDESGYHGWITLDPLELPDRIASAIGGRKYLQSFL